MIFDIFWQIFDTQIFFYSVENLGFIFILSSSTVQHSSRRAASKYSVISCCVSAGPLNFKRLNFRNELVKSAPVWCIVSMKAAISSLLNEEIFLNSNLALSMSTLLITHHFYPRQYTLDPSQNFTKHYSKFSNSDDWLIKQKYFFPHYFQIKCFVLLFVILFNY